MYALLQFGSAIATAKTEDTPSTNSSIMSQVSILGYPLLLQWSFLYLELENEKN